MTPERLQQLKAELGLSPSCKFRVFMNTLLRRDIPGGEHVMDALQRAHSFHKKLPPGPMKLEAEGVLVALQKAQDEMHAGLTRVYDDEREMELGNRA